MLLPGCAVAAAAALPSPPDTSAFAQVASALFTIPAVHALYFGPDFITVTRARTLVSSAAAGAGAWDEGLKDEIVAHLEKFCEEQEQQQQVKEAERLDSSVQFDDPTEGLIVDIIETQVKYTPVPQHCVFAPAVAHCPRPLPLPFSCAAGAGGGSRRRRQHHVQALGCRQRHRMGGDGGRVCWLHHVQGHAALRRAQAAAALRA